MLPHTHRPDLIACPLAWQHAMRRNAAEPRGRMRTAVEAWLLAQRWRRSACGGWADPLDYDVWPLAFATTMQATREAQRLLVARGWQLSGGARCGDSEWWDALVWELHKPDVGRRSVVGALRAEGLVDLPMPALQALITRPALRVLRGGKAA